MRILPILLVLVPFLSFAQLEIDVVPAVEPADGDPEVSAPETSGHASRAKPRPESLRFLNGNELVGTLEEIKQGRLVWTHPDAESPISFATDSLKEIQLKIDESSADALQQLPLITLTNGDEFRGEVAGLSDGVLSVSSPASGSVAMQASMIQKISPNNLTTTIYRGPTDEDEWETHNRNSGSEKWFYQERALYAKDRNLVAVYNPKDMPDQVTISMKLEWKGMLNFQLGYWGDNTKNPNQNISTISLQNNYLRAFRNYNGFGGNNFMNQHIQQNLGDGSVNMTLYLSKSNKQTILFLDGNMIGRWQDVFDGEIPGDLVMLYSQGNSAMRVSNIHIQEWDGELSSGEKEMNSGYDGLTTVTGDEFAGEVIKIADGVLFFKNDFAEFQVPLGRVGEIRFNPETRVKPETPEGALQVFLQTGETFTLGLDTLENGTLHGSSDVTGELSLKLNYFSGMKLNLNDERHQEEEWSW